MTKKLLITFGCSWTFGMSINYLPGMSKDELQKTNENVTDTANKLSFRGLLSAKYNFTNKNFASGASSNQRQFRLAKNFFQSSDFARCKLEYDKIIVLWGITSTARYEMFNVLTNQLSNFFLTHKSLMSEALIKYSYNHNHEVWLLSQEMSHWNHYFNLLGIENFWFDTFNHHDYNQCTPAAEFYKDSYDSVKGIDWPSWQQYITQNFGENQMVQDEMLDSSRFEFASLINTSPISNLLFPDHTPRDLMSQMAILHGLNNFVQQYHTSDWKNDGDRVTHLVKNNLLNPISYHPTKTGHACISDLLDKQIGHVFAADT